MFTDTKLLHETVVKTLVRWVEQCLSDISKGTSSLLLFIESGVQLFNLRKDIIQYCATLEKNELINISYFTAFEEPLLQRSSSIIKQSLHSLTPTTPLVDTVNVSRLWDGVEITCPDGLDVKFNDKLLSIHADIAPLLELVHSEWKDALAVAVQDFADALDGSDLVVARAAHCVAVLIAPLYPLLQPTVYSHL